MRGIRVASSPYALVAERRDATARCRRRHRERHVLTSNSDASSAVEMSDARAPATARGGTQVPQHVLEAIYGKATTTTTTGTTTGTTTTTTTTEIEAKKQRYDESLATWWKTYSERKNDEDEEHVADSLLYDYRHLPRTTPAPNYAEDRLQKVEPGHSERDA